MDTEERLINALDRFVEKLDNRGEVRLLDGEVENVLFEIQRDIMAACVRNLKDIATAKGPVDAEFLSDVFLSITDPSHEFYQKMTDEIIGDSKLFRSKLEIKRIIMKRLV